MKKKISLGGKKPLFFDEDGIEAALFPMYTKEGQLVQAASGICLSLLHREHTHLLEGQKHNQRQIPPRSPPPQPTVLQKRLQVQQDTDVKAPKWLLPQWNQGTEL